MSKVTLSVGVPPEIPSPRLPSSPDTQSATGVDGARDQAKVPSLLEAALRGPQPHVMLTGASARIPEVLGKLRALTGRPVEFVDARSETAAPALRSAVEQRIASTNGALVFLVGSTVPPAVSDLLDEVLDGLFSGLAE